MVLPTLKRLVNVGRLVNIAIFVRMNMYISESFKASAIKLGENMFYNSTQIKYNSRLGHALLCPCKSIKCKSQA